MSIIREICTYNEVYTYTQSSIESAHQIPRVAKPKVVRKGNHATSTSYLAIASCVLEHILRSDKISAYGKLHYLAQSSLAQIKEEVEGKKRASALSAFYVSKLIGGSRAKVYQSQCSLASMGYFDIHKSKNSYDQHKVNLITPTLPDDVFSELSKSPNRHNLSKNYLNNLDNSNKLSYLDKTKLFIIISYSFLKFIISNKSLSYSARIIMLELYLLCYFRNMSVGVEDNYCVLKIEELATSHNLCNRTVRKTLKELELIGLIKNSSLVVKDGGNEEDRRDRFLRKIEIFIPEEHVVSFKKKNTVSNECGKSIKASESDAYRSKDAIENDKITACGSKTDTEIHKRYHADTQIIPPYYTRGITSRNRSTKAAKNLPFIHNDVCVKSKLSNFKNLNSEKDKKLSTVRTSKSNPKTLIDFYPLSKEDVLVLQTLSKREFNTHATNEILLCVARKYPNHSFQTKKAFINYMSIILTHELRQAPIINNESFKIRSNQTNEEIENKKIEEYLSKLENSHSNTSLEAKLKRKLAAMLNPKTAYILLSNIKSLEINNSVLTIETRSSSGLELEEADKQLILKQAELIYEIKLEVLYKSTSGLKHVNEETNEKSINKATILEELNSLKNEWGDIRRALRKFYGEAVDISWFAKLEQFDIDEQEGVLTIKAPTNFIRDWIKSNYLSTMTSVAKDFNTKIKWIDVIQQS